MSKIEKVVLDNGLTIYLYVDKKRHSTFFQHITKFGGITKDFISDGKEYHMQDGIAHILEHYIVEENKYGNFLKLLGEKQMSTNASTHYDMTRFYVSAVEDIEYGIKTLLKGIHSPSFSEERLEKLKGPIYQEIRGKNGNKFFNVACEAYKNLFNKYNFISIGGTLDDVKKTTLEDLIVCYETFYQPSNQMIVVGGNFDKDKILEVIKEFYNELDIPKHNYELIDICEDEVVKNSNVVIEYPTGEEFLEINYKINLEKYSPFDKLKLDFYFNYFFSMYFGLASPLYNKLVKDEVITGGFMCSSIKIYDYLIVSIGTHSNKCDILEKEIKNTINEMNCFDEELFELNKKETILSLIMRDENIGNMVMPFVANIVTYDYPHPDSIEQVESYTFDDFVKTMKEIDFSNYVVALVKNKE